MSTLPYSYHTFLFPFIWNEDKCGNTVFEQFAEVLSVGKRWVDIGWKGAKIPNDQDMAAWLLDYASSQYFTEPANNALFDTRDDKTVEKTVKKTVKKTVRCFKYCHNGSPQKDLGSSTYVITKGSDVFSLLINNIRLNVYSVGVAVLILELENHDRRSLDEVNRINEYGRRISMPYLTPGNPHNLCADKIELFFNGESFSCENYLGTLMSLKGENSEATRRMISCNYVMQPIQKLLKEFYFIKPCIDDRMFVCCLVIDNELSDKVKGVGIDGYSFLDGCEMRMEKDVTGGKVLDAQGNEHEYYMHGWADETYLANILYKFLFIENDVSCQNTQMKKELLLDSVYRRWLDAGTLYGITHHSFVCATNDGVEYAVVNPFLTQYVGLAVLVLTQRAAILALSSEAAIVTDGFSDAYEITPEQIGQIEKLQAKYIKTQNQLLLSEATVQEQGVEIYALLRKQLYINENKAELDGQINNLRDVANISAERHELKNAKHLNYLVAFLAFVTVVLATLQVASAIDCFQSSSFWISVSVLIATVVLAVCYFVYCKCKGR